MQECNKQFNFLTDSLTIMKYNSIINSIEVNAVSNNNKNQYVGRVKFNTSVGINISIINANTYEHVYYEYQQHVNYLIQVRFV